MTRGTFSLGMTLKVIAVSMLAVYLSSPVTPAPGRDDRLQIHGRPLRYRHDQLG